MLHKNYICTSDESRVLVKEEKNFSNIINTLTTVNIHIHTFKYFYLTLSTIKVYPLLKGYTIRPNLVINVVSSVINLTGIQPT